MSAICASPIKAEVARFTLLNACGVPVTGVGSKQVTTDSFTQIEATPNYEDGERFLLRKANGQPCVNQLDAGFFNWVEETTTLCTIDPDLIAFITGATLLVNGVTGTGAMLGEGLITARFSKEVWQQVAGAGACDPSGVQRYFYWAFPNEGDAQIQAFTFADATFEFAFASTTRAASPLWFLGNAWLGTNPVWGPGKHYAFNITTVPPPLPACGAVTI